MRILRAARARTQPLNVTEITPNVTPNVSSTGGAGQAEPPPPARPPSQVDKCYIVADEMCLTVGLCVCWGAMV